MRGRYREREREREREVEIERGISEMLPDQLLIYGKRVREGGGRGDR